MSGKHSPPASRLPPFRQGYDDVSMRDVAAAAAFASASASASSSSANAVTAEQQRRAVNVRRLRHETVDRVRFALALVENEKVQKLRWRFCYKRAKARAESADGGGGGGGGGKALAKEAGKFAKLASARVLRLEARLGGLDERLHAFERGRENDVHPERDADFAEADSDGEGGEGEGGGRRATAADDPFRKARSQIARIAKENPTVRRGKGYAARLLRLSATELEAEIVALMDKLEAGVEELEKDAS